jgi:hypothetical protein
MSAFEPKPRGSTGNISRRKSGSDFSKRRERKKRESDWKSRSPQSA